MAHYVIRFARNAGIVALFVGVALLGILSGVLFAYSGDLLTSVANNILGKTLCAFGDAEATPVLSTVALFREEYEAHIREGRCTVPAAWRAGSRVMAAH